MRTDPEMSCVEHHQQCCYCMSSSRQSWIVLRRCQSHRQSCVWVWLWLLYFVCSFLFHDTHISVHTYICICNRDGDEVIMLYHVPDQSTSTKAGVRVPARRLIDFQRVSLAAQTQQAHAQQHISARSQSGRHVGKHCSDGCAPRGCAETKPKGTGTEGGVRMRACVCVRMCAG